MPALRNLYMAHYINKEVLTILGSRDGAQEPTFTLDDLDRSEKIIGKTRYKKIQSLLKELPENLPLSMSHECIDDLEQSFPKHVLASDRACLVAPCVINYGYGLPLKLFSNIALLLLPESEGKDVSGTYYFSEDLLITLSKVGQIAAFGTYDEVVTAFDDEEQDDTLFTSLELIYSQIREAMFSKLPTLRLFMLEDEWDTVHHYATECLNSPISFMYENDLLIATIPSFISYQHAMYDEEFRLAYYDIKTSLSDFFDIEPNRIRIKLNFDYEMLGFQVGTDVWIESLVEDTPEKVFDKNNRFWWCNSDIKALQSQQHTAQSVAQWLINEGATSLAYYSYLEHDAGNEIAYTFSVFKGRKRLMHFLVSVFDIEQGYSWIEQFKAALTIPMICSDEKEDEWDLIDASQFGFPAYIMPEPPRIVKSAFCVVGLYFVTKGSINAIPRHMTPLNQVPELLSLGGGDPIKITGSLSSPCFVETDDLHAPLCHAIEIINETFEDGASPHDRDFAVKLRFEFQSRIKRRDRLGVLSLMVLDLSETSLTDLMISGQIPVGELERPKLLDALNALYPDAHIERVIMVPLLKNYLGD